MYLPSPRIRKVAMCGPAVYGGLFTLIFEVGDGFKGTRLPHSCQFSHIPGKAALAHILDIWFLQARPPISGRQVSATTSCGRI